MISYMVLFAFILSSRQGVMHIIKHFSEEGIESGLVNELPILSVVMFNEHLSLMY
jgi:hypothetical protein